VGGRLVGRAVLSHPENVRPSWLHARDYGLLVSNPFGRKTFTGGEPSRVVVSPGGGLRLRFGVPAHSGPADRPPDLAAVHADFAG
jgi:hypothetical protein